MVGVVAGDTFILLVFFALFSSLFRSARFRAETRLVGVAGILIVFNGLGDRLDAFPPK